MPEGVGPISLIAAVSPEWVIGVGGKIPWHYKGDMRRFKRMTLGSTVVMGRLTWESMGKRALPGRRNVVITSSPLPAGSGAESFRDLPAALATCKGPVWIIGGARLYAEAMHHADAIDLTYVPDPVEAADAVRFPPIDPAVWQAGPELTHEDEPTLRRRVFTRKTA